MLGAALLTMAGFQIAENISRRLSRSRGEIILVDLPNLVRVAYSHADFALDRASREFRSVDKDDPLGNAFDELTGAGREGRRRNEDSLGCANAASLSTTTYWAVFKSYDPGQSIQVSRSTAAALLRTSLPAMTNKGKRRRARAPRCFPFLYAA